MATNVTSYGPYDTAAEVAAAMAAANETVVSITASTIVNATGTVKVQFYGLGYHA